jgi:uncharacterized protein
MPSVQATPAAVETIERLRRKHGSLVFHQSGGCCDGSAAMCLRADELPPGPNDVELGKIGGAPFLIDRDQHQRWGRPEFVIDVAPGAATSFSLEGAEGVHFVSGTKAIDNGEGDRSGASSSPTIGPSAAAAPANLADGGSQSPQ